MEILAEAATCLIGGTRIVTGMSNLRGYRWLSLDKGTLTLKISAILQHQTDPQIFEIQVRLFQLSTSNSNQYHLVFEGIVTVASQFAMPPSPLSFALTQPASSRWKDSELYSTGMFHGPMFQGVKHIRRWGQEGIEADLQVIPIDNFFSKIAQPVFQTDAGLLDAGGQLLGYWVSEQFGSNFNVFPFQVNAFYQYTQPLPPGSMVCCRGLIKFNEERQAIAHFDFLDDFGNIIARLEGWQDRCFSVPDHFYQCRLQPQTAYLSQPWLQPETQLITRRIPPFPEGFLSDSWGIWQRVLAHLVLNQNERDIWYSLPEKGYRRTDWLLGRIAAKDAVRQWAQTLNLQLAPADIEIGSTQLGQPIVICPELATLGLIPPVSISHSQQHIVAGLSPPGTLLGIDLQRLERLNADDLLINAMTDREIEWLKQLPLAERQIAIVEFWCAKESAAKALGKGLGGNSRSWEVCIDFQGQREVKVLHAREVLLVKLWRFEEEILAICQHPQFVHLPK
jgi:phosphopantetheinyl transferase